MNKENNDLNDAEIALMDAIKSLMEIFMTADIAKPQVFNRLFSHQREAYLAKDMPTAAVIMKLLCQFANDPKREAHRASLRMILREPPQGAA